MATTQSQVGIVAWGDRETYAVDLTTIEPGVAVNVSYSGWDTVAAGSAVYKVSHEVTVEPTTRDDITIRHIRASDVPASSTVSIIPDTVAGGDLVGATVRLYIETIASGSGGIS